MKINENIIHCVGIIKSSSLKNQELCLNNALLYVQKRKKLISDWKNANTN